MHLITSLILALVCLSFVNAENDEDSNVERKETCRIRDELCLDDSQCCNGYCKPQVVWFFKKCWERSTEVIKN